MPLFSDVKVLVNVNNIGVGVFNYVYKHYVEFTWMVVHNDPVPEDYNALTGQVLVDPADIDLTIKLKIRNYLDALYPGLTLNIVFI